MTMKSLGQMKNAPLAYVVAAINFDRQMTLDNHIPLLQEKFQQAGFSRYRASSETVFQINVGNVVQPTVINRHEFSDRENRYAVMLNSETLVFHATQYSNYEDFSGRLASILEIVSSVLKFLFVRRIGLRYVDIIIPKSDEVPDVYVQPGLRCLPKLSLPYKSKSGMAITELQMEKGGLLIRFAVGTIPNIIPMDLNILSLTIPAILQRAQDHTGILATLDIDRYLPYENEFSSSDILSVFNALHAEQSHAFRELITDHAKDVWNKPEESN